MFNESVADGVVPRQRKTAVITPVPKTSKPAKMISDQYRLLQSCHALWRNIVRQYIISGIAESSSSIRLFDQFAFRPSGSTTAALVALFHTVRTLLSTNQFVHVYSFDFSKAFDTVRHYTLMDKMVQMQKPDNIYNWTKDFLMNIDQSLYKICRPVKLL